MEGCVSGAVEGPIQTVASRLLPETCPGSGSSLSSFSAFSFALCKASGRLCSPLVVNGVQRAERREPLSSASPGPACLPARRVVLAYVCVFLCCGSERPCHRSDVNSMAVRHVPRSDSREYLLVFMLSATRLYLCLTFRLWLLCPEAVANTVPVP